MFPPKLYHATGISIHALHEESDQQSADHAVGRHISIHALHEESDVVLFACIH